MTTQNQNGGGTTTILRPGVLLAVSSRVDGGVSYTTEIIEAEHLMEDGAAEAEHKTHKRVENKAEHEQAVKVRGKAWSLVKSACQKTDFGLLCPEAHETDLDGKIAEARSVVAAFNQTAMHTRVTFRVFKGRVAASDEAATQAIGQEIAAAIAAMDEGVAAMDVEAIRHSADSAKELAGMLTEQHQHAVEAAVKAARTIANRVAAAARKGETIALSIGAEHRRVMDAARFAFLDYAEAQPAGQPVAAGAVPAESSDSAPAKPVTVPPAERPLPGVPASRYALDFGPDLAVAV